MDSSEDNALQSVLFKKEFVSPSMEGMEVATIRFDIFDAKSISRYSEIKICNKELYVPLTNDPMPFGVLDNRLGASKLVGLCKTCGQTFQECSGHWGYIPLYHPVFHIGYFKHLINLLYCICKTCSCILLSAEDKAYYLQKSRRCSDPIVRRTLTKRIVAKCKRESVCLKCEAPQGALRRFMRPSLDQFMKIVLQKKVRTSSSCQRFTVII